MSDESEWACGRFTYHQKLTTNSSSMMVDLLAHHSSLITGEMFVVPKGVEHCPVAEEDAHVLLIEPTGTLNTGNAATAAPRVVI